MPEIVVVVVNVPGVSIVKSRPRSVGHDLCISFLIRCVIAMQVIRSFVSLIWSELVMEMRQLL